MAAACRPRSRPDPETVCRPPARITPTFLNPVDAIRHVCPRCKSIALFNQASVAPSFGGGFKNPRRGNGITFEFITNMARGAIFDRQPLRGHEDVLGEYGDIIYWRMRKKDGYSNDV